MGRRDLKCAADECAFDAVTGQEVCVRHGGVRPERLPGAVAPIDAMPKCGAARRDGGVCRQPAMRGQARCQIHGGKAPNSILHAEQKLGERTVLARAHRYGRPRTIQAVDALADEISRAQGHVDWLEQQLAEQGPTSYLLNVYQAERAHLAKLTQAAINANLDERRRVIANAAMEAMNDAVIGTLKHFGLDSADEQVRQVMSSFLQRAVSTATGAPADQRGAVVQGELVKTDEQVRREVEELAGPPVVDF